jgi:small-conductance mechanosensitive channel
MRTTPPGARRFAPRNLPGVTERIIWTVVGFIIGIALAAAVGGSLIQEHGRERVLPYVLFSAIVLGAILAWALNAWVGFVHLSQSGAI